MTIYVALIIASGILFVIFFHSFFSKPEIALYLAFPALLFIPYEFRLPIPVIGSVFGLLLLYSMIVWLLSVRQRGQRIPPTRFGAALWLFVIILLAYGILGWGDPEAAQFRAKFYILGLWSLVLPLLIINTPLKARWLIITAYGTLLAVAITVGYTMIIHGPSIQYSDSRLVQMRYLAQQEYGGSFVNYLVLTAIAITFPVHLSLFLDIHIRRTTRLLFLLISVFMVFVILASSYTSPIVTLLIGVGFLLFFKIRRPNQLSHFFPILPFIAVGVLIFTMLHLFPGLLSSFDRLLNLQTDASGAYRSESMIQGVLAFFESPLIGHGAYNTIVVTRGGNMLGGHNSYIVAAYEFGLIFLLPLVYIILKIVQQFHRLMNRTKDRTIEHSIVQGMFAGVLAALATGFFTPVLGNLAQDSYFWLSVGLMSIWNYWLDENPDARLI